MSSANGLKRRRGANGTRPTKRKCTGTTWWSSEGTDSWTDGKGYSDCDSEDDSSSTVDENDPEYLPHWPDQVSEDDSTDDSRTEDVRAYRRRATAAPKRRKLGGADDDRTVRGMDPTVEQPPIAEVIWVGSIHPEMAWRILSVTWQDD